MKRVTLTAVLFFLLQGMPLSAQQPDPPPRSGQSWGNWRQFASEHFLLLYPDGEQPLAQKIAQLAEEVYPQVHQWFPVDHHQIPLVIYENGDVFNGLVGPQRFVLLNPSPPISYPIFNYQQWLKSLLVHELVHYFSSFSTATSSSISTIFGIFKFLLPKWLIEGSAVQRESLLAGYVGRGNNAYFDLYMRSLVLEKSVRDYYQAGISPTLRGVPGGRSYLLGYYFLDFLGRNYGKQLPLELWAENLSVEDLLKRKTGKNAQYLFTEMLAELDQLYRTNGGNAPPRPALSPPTVNASLPFFNQQGSFFTTSSPDQPLKLWRNPDQPVLEATPPLPASSILTSDRSGATLVASHFFWSADLTPVADLMIRRRGVWRRLSYGESLFQPAISPDGLTLVAVQKHLDSTRLVQVDLSNGRTQILLQEREQAIFAPRWHPNGERLLVQLQHRQRDQVEVWELPWPQIDGRQRLMRGSNRNFQRSFYGPEGAVWFISAREQQLALYRYRPLNDRRQIELMAKDRIGIMDATVGPQGDIYYLTFNNFRTVLKRIEVKQLRPQPQSFDPEPPISPTSSVASPSQASLPSPSRTAKAELPVDQAALDRYFLTFFPLVELSADPNYFFSSVGLQTDIRTLLGWNFSPSLTYQIETNQPQGGLDVSFGPADAFGLIERRWRVGIGMEHRNLASSFLDTGTLWYRQILDFQRLGSGLSTITAIPSIELDHLRLYKSEFSFWQPPAQMVASSTSLSPTLSLTWKWRRNLASDRLNEGAGVSLTQSLRFNWSKFSSFILYSKYYAAVLDAHFDLPVIGRSTLRFNAAGALDDSQNVGASLPPPSGWSTLSSPVDSFAGFQYRLAWRLPFFTFQDTPLGPFGLDMFALIFDFSGRHLLGSGQSSDEYFAGSRLLVNYRFGPVVVSLAVEFGLRLNHVEGQRELSLRSGRPSI